MIHGSRNTVSGSEEPLESVDIVHDIRENDLLTADFADLFQNLPAAFLCPQFCSCFLLGRSVKERGRGGFFQHGRILSILKEQPDGAYDPFACGKLSLGISWP